MGLLRKLFCKEEPQPAPAHTPEAAEDTRPVYAARSPYRYIQTLTCFWCGCSEEVEGSSSRGPDGWKAFHGMGLPNGHIEACPRCRPKVTDQINDVAFAHAHREAEQRKRRGPAYVAQRAWDAAHPAPKLNVPNSTFIFIRRTTCGACGLQVDHEGKQHELPSWPPGWERVCDDRGPVVCPDCYDKNEAIRVATKKHRTDRELWVGGYFRAADEGLPPIRKLKLPDRWKPL